MLDIHSSAGKGDQIGHLVELDLRGSARIDDRAVIEQDGVPRGSDYRDVDHIDRAAGQRDHPVRVDRVCDPPRECHLQSMAGNGQRLRAGSTTQNERANVFGVDVQRHRVGPGERDVDVVARCGDAAGPIRGIRPVAAGGVVPDLRRGLCERGGQCAKRE